VRAFRFGVVVGRVNEAAQWTALARRAEDLGYSTFLAPDSRETMAPIPALAAAAAVTTKLRFATHVLAAPFYTVGQVAWQAATLDLLSGGRFELGLGAGRPGADKDAARLGLSFGSPAERVGQLEALIEGVRKAFADDSYPQPVQRPHPPIVIAASGRRMLALAAREADTIALAVPPDTTDDGLAERAERIRESGRDPELGLSLHNVGTDVPPWMSQGLGLDVPALIAAGASSILVGTPREMADTLLRRRERTGISYIMVGQHSLDALAPVMELLDGQ
jgi:probable F420-dependent oxidoreductase